MMLFLICWTNLCLHLPHNRR